MSASCCDLLLHCIVLCVAYSANKRHYFVDRHIKICSDRYMIIFYM